MEIRVGEFLSNSVLSQIVQDMVGLQEGQRLNGALLTQFNGLLPEERQRLVGQLTALILQLPLERQGELLTAYGELLPSEETDEAETSGAIGIKSQKTIDLQNAHRANTYLEDVTDQLMQEPDNPELAVFKNPDPQLLAMLNPPAPDMNPQL
ncbi:hypothetical protein KC660_03280 [Candidatus Dojkabacteria bacterium]|uniref:Uncharacterized protein n=1 Tax=Candidatus Dojkabacteria bacterium TaxID=2099670 RepID=A0A955L3R2_9BACT|nr:hypothetical protein [Candidatus Dojkabacteria bacterium]